MLSAILCNSGKDKRWWPVHWREMEAQRCPAVQSHAQDCTHAGPGQNHQQKASSTHPFLAHSLRGPLRADKMGTKALWAKAAEKEREGKSQSEPVACQILVCGATDPP